MRGVYAFCVAGLALVGPASAYPNGAPWGSADPKAAQNCSSCHFDSDPRLQSPVVRIVGDIPEAYSSGANYGFIVTVRAPEGAKVGFALKALSTGDQAGNWSPEGQELESSGNEVRSVKPKYSTNDGFVFWGIRWTAPKAADDPVTFYLAVNISNDDDSPFGDEIHYFTFSIPPQ